MANPGSPADTFRKVNPKITKRNMNVMTTYVAKATVIE